MIILKDVFNIVRLTQETIQVSTTPRGYFRYIVMYSNKEKNNILIFRSKDMMRIFYENEDDFDIKTEVNIKTSYKKEDSN